MNLMWSNKDVLTQGYFLGYWHLGFIVFVFVYLPCRDDGPLPEDVELVGRNLTIQSLVKHQHAGLYECNCSYLHLKATLQFNLTVKAQPPLLGG